MGKMKELWDSSNETYAQVEKVAVSLKKKVVSTFKLTTNLSLSYEKESDLQKENLNKVENNSDCLKLIWTTRSRVICQECRKRQSFSQQKKALISKRVWEKLMS